MKKLRRDMRIAMLGAAAGLFSISVFLLIARIDAYYSYLADITYGPYERGVEDLGWLPVAFWHTLLSIVASLAAHRYLTTSRWSPFLLWQTIGFIVLLGWVFTLSSIVGLECLMDGNLNSRLMTEVEATSVFKYVSSVFACHVMYGSAMQAASREYLEEKPDLCESSGVLMPHRSFQKGSKGSSLLIGEKQIEGTKT